MTRRVWLTLTALTLSTVALAYYQLRDVAAEAPAFGSAEVTRGPVVSTVQATGTLEAVTTVQVGSQVSGAIQTLYADFNSTVRRGQVIAELDPSLFETQVEQAQATLVRVEADVERARVQADDAQVKLRRARELFGRELLPTTDLETAESNAKVAGAAVRAAEAQVVQARASLNQAQVNLSHTIIRAPIDGVVIARNVDVGQTVAASMQAPTLFVLARDLTEMRVNASVDESDIGEVRPGQPVRFRVDAYPDATFTGTVSQVRLQAEVQQNVVSYVTVIDVPNPDLELKPGMTAAVTIETARADDVMRVPNAALRFRPTGELLAALGQPPSAGPGAPAGADALPAAEAVGRRGPGDTIPAQREAMRARPGSGTDEGDGGGDRAAVWVLEQNALRQVPVRAGLSDGTQTAILAGDIEPGAQVVTSVLTGSVAAAAPASSPLLPFGQRPGVRR
jgi:HlyD family secretion protein